MKSVTINYSLDDWLLWFSRRWSNLEDIMIGTGLLRFFQQIANITTVNCNIPQRTWDVCDAMCHISSDVTCNVYTMMCKGWYDLICIVRPAIENSLGAQLTQAHKTQHTTQSKCLSTTHATNWMVAALNNDLEYFNHYNHHILSRDYLTHAIYTWRIWQNLIMLEMLDESWRSKCNPRNTKNMGNEISNKMYAMFQMIWYTNKPNSF